MMMIMNQENKKEQALLDLMNKTGYPVVQENGQRKFGPPSDWGANSPPPKGSEIFIGKIPRDCYEDELVPLFSRIGKIYELRLMMDFSGSNRGYAFISYCDPSHAKKAVQELNDYHIRPGKSIGVVKSKDNCRLFVGRIPKDKTREEIVQEMRSVTEDVVDAIVHNYYKDRSKNRGYAFVEYENHRAAAMARRLLLPGKIKLFGCDINVDWADPEPEVDDEIMRKVSNLYVRNLEQSVSEFELMELFSFRKKVNVVKVKKIKDFAFIHYETRQQAVWAISEIQSHPDFGTHISTGNRLEVTWAKPPDRQHQKQERRSKNLYNQGDVGHYNQPSPSPRMSYMGNRNGYMGTPNNNLNSNDNPWSNAYNGPMMSPGYNALLRINTQQPQIDYNGGWPSDYNSYGPQGKAVSQTAMSCYSPQSNSIGRPYNSVQTPIGVRPSNSRYNHQYNNTLFGNGNFNSSPFNSMCNNMVGQMMPSPTFQHYSPYQV